VLDRLELPDRGEVKAVLAASGPYSSVCSSAPPG